MIRTNKQAAIGPDNNLWSESLLTYIRKKIAIDSDNSPCLEGIGVFRSRLQPGFRSVARKGTHHRPRA